VFSAFFSLQFEEHVLKAGVALDLFHCAGADELSAFYYRDLVAELFGNFEHMGREEYCAAGVADLAHHAF
jgi:hypothetical protein